MDNIFEPKTMLGLVEFIPKTSTFLVDKFFKAQPPHVTEKVSLDFKSRARKVAPFVHPRAGSEVILNEGYTTKEYNTPLIAPAKVVDTERLKSRMAGENPYSGTTPAERAAKYIIEDMQEMTESINRRLEWMAAQTIFGGKIPVVGKSINEDIDFGFVNSEILKTTALWSESTSDPTADLMRWKEKARVNSGRNANIAVCSKDVMLAYINHPKIKETLDIRNYMLGKVAPEIKREDVVYFATNRAAMVDLYCYDAVIYDDFTDAKNPKDVPLVPEGAIALIPENGDFRIQYGAITIIPHGGKSFVTYDMPIVPHNYVEHHPDRLIFEMLARPLTHPVEVDSWFTATVL